MPIPVPQPAQSEHPDTVRVARVRALLDQLCPAMRDAMSRALDDPI